MMAAWSFHNPAGFRSAVSRYQLLPFRFLRWPDGQVLVTNEVGEFEFLPPQVFADFHNKSLERDAPQYRYLKAKHFLTDSPSTVPIELLATKYRTKKAFLDGFTKLHMFVVTLRCDHACPYCQVSRVTTDREQFEMSAETAERAIDLMFRCPAPVVKVEFQGGEPLLNFERVRQIVTHAKVRSESESRHVEFVIATNLSQVSDEILAFCRGHRVCISTSLDGPEWLHNANRPCPGANSYQLTTENIGRVRAALGHDQVSALMTTTRRSLQFPREIVDEYVRQGFDNIFLRPMRSYGFAAKRKSSLGYEMDEFLTFYKTALEYIIEVNRSGTGLVEVYAQILLQKMLTPYDTGYVDLQSPTGMGIGGVIYNYDGDVYASDEGRMLAEMGDRSFQLGSVHRDSFEDIFGGETLRAIVENSIIETLPGCSDCAFVPYCGVDPVFNWTTEGDVIGHQISSPSCQKNMGIIRHLFDLFHRGDDFTRALFLSWAMGPIERPAREEPAP